MKMRLISGLAILLFLFVCTSCNSRLKDTEETLKFISSNMAFSTKLIEQQNATTYGTLHEKLFDPVTKYKAKLWEPKALVIQRQSNQVNSYLNALEKNVNTNGEQLWHEIEKFKDSLLSIDSLINLEFASEIHAFPKSYDSSVKSETFIKTKLPRLSPDASRAFIDQLSSQVRLIENRLVRFCLEQCSFNVFVFDSYSAIVGQSSSVVGAGEEIKIIAGVGAFSRKAEPLITIDGKTMEISEDGAAYYQFKTPTKVGGMAIANCQPGTNAKLKN